MLETILRSNRFQIRGRTMDLIRERLEKRLEEIDHHPTAGWRELAALAGLSLKDLERFNGNTPGIAAYRADLTRTLEEIQEAGAVPRDQRLALNHGIPVLLPEDTTGTLCALVREHLARQQDPPRKYARNTAEVDQALENLFVTLNDVKERTAPSLERLGPASRTLGTEPARSALKGYAPILRDDRAPSVDKMTEALLRWTQRDIGDGSATVMAMAETLYLEARRHMVNCVDPKPLLRGMERGLNRVLQHLETQTLKSAGAFLARLRTAGIKLPGKVRQALKEASVTGAYVRRSKENRTRVSRVKGLFLPRLRVHRAAHTPAHPIFDQPRLLFCKEAIRDYQDLVPLLKQVEEQQSALVICVPDMEESLLAWINRFYTHNCAVVRTGPGEPLPELARHTGGHLFAHARAIQEKPDLSRLGRARKACLSRNGLLLVGVGPNQVFQITVGGKNEAERRHNQLRMQRLLQSAVMADREGIVAGGGTALIRALPALDTLADLREDESFGVAVVKKALAMPLYQIAHNGGYQGNKVVEAVSRQDGAIGFDLSQGTLTDLICAGISDSVRVIQGVLRNAICIPSLFLTLQEPHIARCMTREAAPVSRSAGKNL